MEDDFQRYLREKEEAVSNQSGSSASDVLFTILPNVCSILLALTFITLAGPQTSRQTRLLIEFCITVIPCILTCTVLSEKVIAISNIFLVVSAANILSILAWRQNDNFRSIPVQTTNKHAFITNFRALVNIMTAVCILAVDFNCFPRKFVKTETYGYSLMDAGVGLFIISNALVAPEARLIKIEAKPFFKNLRKTVIDCLPLIGLGLARCVAVKVLGYQQHVSEYGEHWNFFLTLASVKLFMGLLPKFLSSKYSLLFGLWILIMHEYILTQGWKEWVLSKAPRNDLISSNREGLVSIPGYVGLYLICIALGRLIHSAYQQNENELVFNFKLAGRDFKIGYTKSMELAFKLYMISNIAFASTYYCEQYFQISRRLANLGYCSWILTLGTLTLTFLLMIDVILECITGCIKEKTRHKFIKNLRKDDLNAKESINVVKTLEIFEAVNENGLFFFLFANLMTGGLNMTMNTLQVLEPRAVSIIIFYMIVNITFVWLRRKGNDILKSRRESQKDS